MTVQAQFPDEQSGEGEFKRQADAFRHYVTSTGSSGYPAEAGRYHLYVSWALAGLSMGGALALLMSTRLDVIGTVAMSAPYKLPDDPRLRHIDLIAKTIPYMPKGDGAPGDGWFDKEVWKDHISYPQNPVRSIGQLNKLLAEMRASLPQLREPVLLIHSQDDDYVLPGNMELIFTDLINDSDKTKLYIRGSGHVITRDAAHQQVFQYALDFVQRIGTPQVQS